MEKTLNISLNYDEKASVWIAESDDVPGLVLESGSLDALIERVKMAVPELLELNGINERIMLSLNATRVVAAYG